MTYSNQEVLNASKHFSTSIQHFLCPSFHLKTDAVLDAIGHNINNTVPGFQISDKYIWEATLSVKKDIVPHLNKELQASWNIIEQFLYICLGKDVEKHYVEIEAVNKEIQAFRAKHQLITTFNIPGIKSGILNDIYPKKHSHISYTEVSGWGEPSSVALPENFTYGDLWLASEKLFNQSKDIQNNTIVNFVSSSEGLVAIFDLH